MESYFQDILKNIDLTANKPLNEVVYLGLRRSIILGVIPVGTRINELKYAEALNISRTPIREAIKRILYEGLLDYVPGVGTVVSNITKNDVIEVYELRTVLEKLAFNKAMHHLTDDELNSLQADLEKTLEHYDTNNTNEVIRLSKIFNDTIFSATKMPRLISLINNIQDYLARFRYLALSDNVMGPQAIREHLLIVRAMRNKDEEQMNLIIEEHLLSSRNRILGILVHEENT